MKGHEYVLLSSLYYNNKSAYDELYEYRINSDECVLLNFMIGDNQAFFMETPELVKSVVDIIRLDKEIYKLSKSLPNIALKQYINKCLIDEIVITNNIEGVHSTRKEIGEILDDLEGKSKKRFYGLVNKYAALMAGSDINIANSQDVRKLYDEMFLREILEEDPDDAPDGKIFRKNQVDVVNPAQKVIHHGVYPESEIISSMDKAIEILNDSEIEPLFRIAIFHYLFGYIHPFYDGNGRLNRFICSSYLGNALESIMAYRLSYTIKENISKYYKSFKVVNDKVNKGDLTPFIFTYLDFIMESEVNLKEGLEKKAEELKHFASVIPSLPYGTDEKFTELYSYLLQASLFAELGLSANELMKDLSVSRPTLLKRLKELEQNNLLQIVKRDANKFYQLNLEVVTSYE